MSVDLWGLVRYRSFLISSAAASAHGHCRRILDLSKNEQDIGLALKELFDSGKIKREDLFITSKIAPKDQGYEKAYSAVQDSLHRLGPHVKYWPGTQGVKVYDPINKSNRRGTWKALEKALEEGKVRAIGVSNYNIEHLKEFLEDTTASTQSDDATSQSPPIKILPHINQFELHPLLPQWDLVKFCCEHGIAVQAYSSFGEGRLVKSDEQEIKLKELEHLTQKHSVSRAQILLRWAIQHEYMVIPKASNQPRLEENLNFFHFKLDDEVRS
ncbi:hypothetical protein HK102_013911 [Quaeritorhiza haematococci]|nr:hypothetical protein HK102_013911 [Quaeritorhiza haematococci]